MRQASRGTNEVRVNVAKAGKIFLLLFALFFAFSNVAFAADKVNVYYFYGKPRCMTCLHIEKYTKGAVESMKDKDIVYKGIDMDNPANKGMVKKYNLYTKAVILSKVKNGKEQWKNLDKIWTLVGFENKFKNYIITETKAFKGGK